MTYAICGVRLVSAVDRKPKRVAGRELARVRWLRARPRAALTVDHYEDDWAELAWVQALGSVHLVDAADAVDELAALSERFPAYRAAPPPGPVLVLEVDRVLWWRAA